MRKKGTALRLAQEADSWGSAPASQPTPPAPADLVKPPLPEFTPVPRKYRHDGWTPERQKAFIEALADCGSVTRAAAVVNRAQANCYTLRRAPGAEESPWRPRTLGTFAARGATLEGHRVGAEAPAARPSGRSRASSIRCSGAAS